MTYTNNIWKNHHLFWISLGLMDTYCNSKGGFANWGARWNYPNFPIFDGNPIAWATALPVFYHGQSYPSYHQNPNFPEITQIIQIAFCFESQDSCLQVKFMRKKPGFIVQISRGVFGPQRKGVKGTDEMIQKPGSQGMYFGTQEKVPKSLNPIYVLTDELYSQQRGWW